MELLGFNVMLVIMLATLIATHINDAIIDRRDRRNHLLTRIEDHKRTCATIDARIARRKTQRIS